MKKTLLLNISFVFILLFSWQCSKNNAKASSEAKGKKIPQLPVEVQTAPAFNGRLQKFIHTEGRAEALRKTPVIFLQSGYLLKMPLKEGQSIKKGALVARLENKRQAIALAESKSALVKAIAEFAAQSGGRQKALQLLKNPDIQNQLHSFLPLDSLAQNILSGKQRAQTLMAYSGLSQAYTAYRRAMLDYQKTSFYAPYNAVAGNIEVKQGAYVTAGQPVCWLYDLSKIKIRVEVLESEAPSVQTGSECLVTFTALPGQTFKGKVYAKNTALNEERHTLRVTVLLKNHSRGVTPGMSAAVKIQTRLEKETLLVPKRAVLERDGRYLVFVVRDSVANWCYITPGASNDQYMQVLASEFHLKAGEPVITEGQFTLAHGARVRVKK